MVIMDIFHNGYACEMVSYGGMDSRTRSEIATCLRLGWGLGVATRIRALGVVVVVRAKVEERDLGSLAILFLEMLISSLMSQWMNERMSSLNCCTWVGKQICPR